MICECLQLHVSDIKKNYEGVKGGLSCVPSCLPHFFYENKLHNVVLFIGQTIIYKFVKCVGPSALISFGISTASDSDATNYSHIGYENLQNLHYCVCSLDINFLAICCNLALTCSKHKNSVFYHDWNRFIQYCKSIFFDLHAISLIFSEWSIARKNHLAHTVITWL